MLDFKALLTEICRIQIAGETDAANLPSHKFAAGWLGEPGASEAEIASAEARLGIRLPPSYRAFLAITDGFDNIGPFIYRLYSASEIDWFRIRHQDWIEAYQTPSRQYRNADDISPEEHLRNPKDEIRFRKAYLSSCLQISETGDSAVVLLNPEVINDECEWETWFFANWLPGATRYPSSHAYVEGELASMQFLRDAEEKRGGRKGYLKGGVGPVRLARYPPSARRHVNLRYPLLDQSEPSAAFS